MISGLGMCERNRYRVSCVYVMMKLSVDLSGNRLQSFHFVKQAGNTLL